MCYLPLRLLGWKTSCIQAARHRILAEDPRLQPAVQQLLRDAAAAMHAGPYSVTFKKIAPPSGDLHDYLSFEDGSDDAAVAAGDRPSSSDVDRRPMQALSKAVQALALAHTLRGDAKYSAHAASLLRTWFLDPATRMNPHVQYGHTIPGEPQGCEEALQETACLLPLLDCSLLLLGSHRWTLREHEGLARWFTSYLAWLQQSDIGQAAAARFDSLATWYEAQVAAYGVFAGKEEVARAALERARGRLDQQFTRDGRPRIDAGISYCCYNLHGLFSLAHIGEAVGIDLWHFETARGRSLLKAMRFLAPYADFGRAWENEDADTLLADLYQPVVLSPRAKLAGLLAQAQVAWADEDFSRWFKMLPQDLTLAHRCRLLWAPPAATAQDSGDTTFVGYKIA